MFSLILVLMCALLLCAFAPASFSPWVYKRNPSLERKPNYAGTAYRFAHLV